MTSVFRKISNSLVVIIVIVAACIPGRALANIWKPLEDRLVEDGFPRKEIHTLFSRPEVAYSSKPLRQKLRSLYRRDFSGRRMQRIQTALQKQGFAVGKADGVYGAKTAAAIKKFQKKAGLEVNGIPSKELEEHLLGVDSITARGWTSRVYDSAKHPLWLAEARAFGIENRPHFLRMSREYGVPPEIVGGIITVETRQGTFLGGEPAMLPLASMALGTDYELVKPMFKGIRMIGEQTEWLKSISKARADWAYDELKALLAHARELGRDPLAVIGSPYGAIGIAQFMPSNIPKHGVDGDRDGKVDLFTPADAIHSAGRYIHDYGWGPSTKTLDQMRTVLFGYNHSQRYVNSVLTVAGHLQRAFKPVEMKRPGKTVRVRTAGELLQAIRPGAHVILESGVYDLTGAPRTASVGVRWLQGAPVFFDVPDLTLEAEEVAVLISVARSAPVLLCAKCPNLRLVNLLFRHPTPKRGARPDKGAALLALESCSGARLEFCQFLGGDAFPGSRALGGPGLMLRKSNDVSLRHCLFNGVGGATPALEVEQCPGAVFHDVVMQDNPGTPLAVLQESPDAVFENCLLRRNGPFPATSGKKAVKGSKEAEKDTSTMFSLLRGNSSLFLKNSLLTDNLYGQLTDAPPALKEQEIYSKRNKFKQ